MCRSIYASCVALIGVLLSACGGGVDGGATATSAKTASQMVNSPTTSESLSSSVALALITETTDVRLKSLTKVSETRVGRTVFDYVFRVELTNAGSGALNNVKGLVTASGDGTTIIDAAVNVGNMSAGQTLTPADTITLRHDRTKTFQSTALVWSFTSESTLPATVPGILLPGDPNDLASNHLQTYTAPRTDEDLRTIEVPGDATYYRTQIYAAIARGATVGQVNNALNAVGGRIGFIESNSPVVTIQVPDPGSIAALEGIANALINSGAFESASLVAEAKPDAIPQDPQNVTQAQAVTSGGPVFHHLAARFGGLWSMRNLEVEPEAAAQLIVADYFGDGPVTGLAGAATGIQSGFLCGAVKCTHGYHVLGIVAGSFGGANSDPERVTGANPFPLKINVIDLSAIAPSRLMMEEFIVRGLKSIFTNGYATKYVLSMSLNTCDTAGVSCQTLERVTRSAELWRQRVRNIWPVLPVTAPFDYDRNVVQVSSAGNRGPQASATQNSPWNAAVKLGKLGAQDPLTNGLIVENRTATLVNGIPVVGQRAGKSTAGGNIAAVGENVYSFTGPASVGNLNGTSMATPQVAGLVGAMLAFRPALTPQDIVAKVTKIRFIDDPSSAPAIDAYAVMLSLDNNMTDAPVRKALLRASVTSPGAASQQLMNFADAQEFLKAYFPSAYGLPAKTQPAFSRFDLNGDGHDGDLTKVLPFDMKFDGKNEAFKPTKIDGYSVGTVVELDEAAATDFQILCYYIQSPLFDASHKAAFDAELARLSQLPTVGRKVSCNDPMVVLEVKELVFGWSGLPATITLKDFVTPFPATFAGNSSTCTNQGASPGERGFPLFSASVPAPVQILAAITVNGVPWPNNGGAVNRRNCSSFYAADAQQVWINATGRAVFGFGGVAVSDWEYQVRYTNGLGGVGKKCSVGTVPNSNFFAASFEATQCAHKVTAVVAE